MQVLTLCENYIKRQDDANKALSENTGYHLDSPRTFICLVKERRRPWDAERVLCYLPMQLGPRRGFLGPSLLNGGSVSVHYSGKFGVFCLA